MFRARVRRRHRSRHIQSPLRSRTFAARVRLGLSRTSHRAARAASHGLQQRRRRRDRATECAHETVDSSHHSNRRLGSRRYRQWQQSNATVVDKGNMRGHRYFRTVRVSV